MTSSYDIVWPFGVPDVCTAFWSENDWLMWCLRFRPKDYHGADDDTEAWKQYQETKRKAQYDALLKRCLDASENFQRKNL